MKSYKSRIVDIVRSRQSHLSFDSSFQHAQKFLRNHPQQPLTKGEEEEIDMYWAKYGIRWPDYSWFQMYYGISGIKSPEFIPGPIAGKVLLPYYNPRGYIKGWDDKNLYERFLPSVQFPKTLCHCMNSRYYDDCWTPFGSSEKDIHLLACKIMNELKLTSEVIVKDTSRTYAGKGVTLYRVDTLADMENILKTRKSKDFIMQEKIIQHPVMGQFCSTSVNIIRIVSFRYGDDVLVFPASIRFGVEGSITDVSFDEGKEIVYVVGINKDGSINNKYFSFDGKFNPVFSVKEKMIPSFQKIISIIQTAHKQMYYFDLIGWDFSIDVNENPICIEYNVIYPGMILYQYTNGPFCGNYTDQFLEPLNKDRIREKIPRKYRLR